MEPVEIENGSDGFQSLIGTIYTGSTSGSFGAMKTTRMKYYKGKHSKDEKEKPDGKSGDKKETKPLGDKRNQGNTSAPKVPKPRGKDGPRDAPQGDKPKGEKAVKLADPLVNGSPVSISWAESGREEIQEISKPEEIPNEPLDSDDEQEEISLKKFILMKENVIQWNVFESHKYLKTFTFASEAQWPTTRLAPLRNYPVMAVERPKYFIFRESNDFKLYKGVKVVKKMDGHSVDALNFLCFDMPMRLG